MSGAAVEIASIQGGSKRNAIPREASATVVIDHDGVAGLRRLAASMEAAERLELGTFDPGVRITVESAEAPDRVLQDEDAIETVDLLASQHHGVLAMSPDVPGLV